MDTTVQNSSVQFARVVSLQASLSELILEGQGDASSADDIRFEMDDFWWDLPPTEQNRIEGLAADLQRTPSVGIHTVPMKYQQKVEQLLREAQLWEALDYIRSHQDELPADYSDHIRGICWADLKEINVATKFFEKAYHHNPGSPKNLYCLLRATLIAGKSARIHELVQQIISPENLTNHRVEIVYLAAALRFQSTLNLVGIAKIEAYRQVIQAVESANSRLITGDLKLFRSEAGVANQWRALAYDQLDQHDQAIAACREAMQWDPDNQVLPKLWSLLNSVGYEKDVIARSFIISYADRLVDLSAFPNAA